VSHDAAPFYDDLDLSLAEAARLIAEGAGNRNSPAHCPVVATIDVAGAPTQRVMILREVDWQARLLRFHTDIRTEKARELAANGDTSVLFYDPAAKIQLRLQGSARTEVEGDLAERAWASSTNFARRCYLAEAAPGGEADAPTSGLPKVIEGRQPEESELAPARANFAVLLFTFAEIEWLYLANSGHRRARWRWDSVAGRWDGCWLVP
jgi:pyridoxamine 5'-phosphate oxidase